jgi:hypothetical protein
MLCTTALLLEHGGLPFGSCGCCLLSDAELSD